MGATGVAVSCFCHWYGANAGHESQIDSVPQTLPVIDAATLLHIPLLCVSPGAIQRCSVTSRSSPARTLH